MVLTERDQQILRYAYEHRLINSKHICQLLGAGTPGAVRKIGKRLRLLFDHRYLDVPLLQRADHRRRGSVPKVYAITKRGARAIERPWGSRNDEISRAFFGHTLMVTSIMVALKSGARDLGTLRVVPFEELLAGAPKTTKEARYPNRWKVEVTSREAKRVTWKETLGVTPDKIFALEFERAPKGRGRFLLFLEADRGTEPIVRGTARGKLARLKQLTSIYRKLLAYNATYKDRLGRRYGFTNGFRVLFVTTKPNRVQSMIDAVETLTGSRRMFLFATEEELLAGNACAHEWLNGQGEEVRLIDTAF